MEVLPLMPENLCPWQMPISYSTETYCILLDGSCIGYDCCHHNGWKCYGKKNRSNWTEFFNPIHVTGLTLYNKKRMKFEKQPDQILMLLR
jgi:hypothetical protein